MKTALVTGASRGIGAEIARQLAARGIRVVLHYNRSHHEATQVLESLHRTPEAHKAPHQLISFDLSDTTGISSFWGSVLAHCDGRAPDMLIHNAGVYEEHDPQSCSAEETARVWHQTLSINLMAPAVLSPLFAQCHVTQGTRGVVVAVSSRGAFRGEPTAPGYGASKAGLNAMMQSMAKAFAPRGVYFYTVAPGWVETEMARGTLEGPRGAEVLRDQPMGRVAHPGEVASVVVYCALDAVPQMTGCIIDVNGASYLRT